MKSQPYGTAPFDSIYAVLEQVTLNMSNFEGGNNKFYHMEIHKDAQQRYRLYSRYGRTGKSGTEEERIPANEAMARKEFASIQREKERKGYKEVVLAASKMGSEVANLRILSNDVKMENVKTEVDNTTSVVKIDSNVARLVNRLYEEAGEATRSQLSGTLNASADNPLGTLTLGQINAGKEVLQNVNAYLSTRPDLVNNLDPQIISYSNDFYSLIPQRVPLRPRDSEGRDRWMRQYALNRPSILDEKHDLLDLLGDVQGMVRGFETNDVAMRYKQMEAEISWLPPDDLEYKAAEAAIINTQSNHHSWRLRVKNVFKIDVRAQRGHDQHVAQIGNAKPLFHGSRNGNILGISKKGLLLRPPGAYVTGSMFGNGLYFADQSTKSSQYSSARYGGSSGSSESYFMFIADVGLGKIKEYTSAQTHLQRAPDGYHSVMGKKGPSLIHNEFIIYDLKQQKLQYLVEFTQSYR